MKNINKQRVEGLLQGLAGFGAVPGAGITRLAYSATDRAAQNWLLEQVASLQLEISEDAVGNLHLLRPGKNRALPPVATGSHLDTVIHGGAYDGMCGVVGALEALYMLQQEELERSLEVIVFRAEESSRFSYATVGSKLMTGVASLEKLSQGTKKGDISLPEAMQEWGCVPENYTQAIKKPGDYKCFAEMHIEQGKVLEELGVEVGIVHGIAAPTRFKLHVQGMADHSGATPMGMRHDALVSAAKLVLAVEQSAMAEKESGTVGTVGVVEVDPGSINVVPGAVTLWVDVRGVQQESIDRCLEGIMQQAAAIAAADDVQITKEMLTADKPVALDETLVAQSESICREKGISFKHMVSGAGHDAMHMANICPTTMLFIPCRGGISHNPAEFAENEDICKAIEILAEILYREAKA